MKELFPYNSIISHVSDIQSQLTVLLTEPDWSPLFEVENLASI